MTEAFRSALEVALTLSEPERAELAEILNATISEAYRSEIREAWIAEIDRRDRAINDGIEELIDGDEILERLSRGV